MNRRRFLQALGASAICAPFIPDLARAEAGNAANAGRSRKRANARTSAFAKPAST